MPDLDDPAAVDLRANYHQNRVWLYGILSMVVVVSLANESIAQEIAGALSQVLTRTEQEYVATVR